MGCHVIIDFHAYIGSDPYGDYSQSVDQLIASMDDCGIDIAVVAPLADFPGPDHEVHHKLNQARQRFPDRLIPFARVDPRYGKEALQALDFAIGVLEFRGLFFNPVTTNSLPYHPGVLPLMHAAAERNIPVLIPAGNGYLGLPEQVAWLAASVPDLKVVMGHMGTASHAVRAIALAAEHPNLYLETSLQQSPVRLSLAVEQVGPERVLFGSAAPYSEPAVELLKVHKAGLVTEVTSKILGANASRLLGLEQLRGGA